MSCNEADDANDANDQSDKPDDKYQGDHTMGENPPSGMSAAEERIRQLAKVVCICKGINLGRVLKGLEGCDTVADVNRKVGTGSGGCQGERCGPRIKLLLKKYKDAKQR